MKTKVSFKILVYPCSVGSRIYQLLQTRGTSIIGVKKQTDISDQNDYSTKLYRLISLIVCSCIRKIQVWPCVPLISREVPCCFCKMLNTWMFFLVVQLIYSVFRVEPFFICASLKKSLNVSQSNSHVCFTQKCCSSLGSSVYRSHSVWQTQGFHSIAGSLSNPSNDKKHTGSL